MPRERLIAIGQTLSILVMMSLGTVFMKLALADVAPLTLTWTTVAIGMGALSLYTFAVRGEQVPRGLGWRVWAYIIAIGICNFVIARITRPFALERLPATATTYLGNFIGFATMAMSVFVLKETPTISQILGAVVAFLRLRVFFTEALSGYELVGVALIVAGLVAVAFTNNIARKLTLTTNDTLSNNIVSTMALLIGGAITVLAGLILDWPPRVSGWQNWAVIIYVGVATIAVGLTGWNYVLRTLRSYEASILGASTVFWTALLAAFILGERLALNQMIGIGMMIMGLALVQVRRGQLSTLVRRSAAAGQPRPETRAAKDGQP